MCLGLWVCFVCPRDFFFMCWCTVFLCPARRPIGGCPTLVFGGAGCVAVVGFVVIVAVAVDRCSWLDQISVSRPSNVFVCTSCSLYTYLAAKSSPWCSIAEVERKIVQVYSNKTPRRKIENGQAQITPPPLPYPPAPDNFSQESEKAGTLFSRSGSNLLL